MVSKVSWGIRATTCYRLTGGIGFEMTMAAAKVGVRQNGKGKFQTRPVRPFFSSNTLRFMAALETVYATHNFEAENEDEITIKAGEPVIVLEKDEKYQDGWWQVCSIRASDLEIFFETASSRHFDRVATSKDR